MYDLYASSINRKNIRKKKKKEKILIYGLFDICSAPIISWLALIRYYEIDYCFHDRFTT